MDFSEITKTVEKMQSEMKALQDAYKEKMQKLFTDATKEFFKEGSKVKAICWNQYVPYFNDGDECVFTLYSVNFFIGDKFNVDEQDIVALSNEDWEDEDEDFPLDCLSLSKYSRYDDNDEYDKETYNACVAMSKIIFENTDIMQEVFGSYAAVCITAEKTVVEEYEAPY